MLAGSTPPSVFVKAGVDGSADGGAPARDVGLIVAFAISGGCNAGGTANPDDLVEDRKGKPDARKKVVGGTAQHRHHADSPVGPAPAPVSHRAKKPPDIASQDHGPGRRQALMAQQLSLRAGCVPLGPDLQCSTILCGYKL